MQKSIIAINTLDAFADFYEEKDMATRNGTPGNDTLTGTASADSLFGLAGNDSLLGLGSDDRLFGGTGSDPHIWWSW